MINGSVAYVITLPGIALPHQKTREFAFIYINPLEISRDVVEDVRALDQEIAKHTIQDYHEVVLIEVEPKEGTPQGVADFSPTDRNWYRSHAGWKKYWTSIRQKMAPGDYAVSISGNAADTAIVLGLSALAAGGLDFNSEPAVVSALLTLGLTYWDSTWRNFLNASHGQPARRLSKAFTRSMLFRYTMFGATFGWSSLAITDMSGGLNHLFLAINAIVSTHISDKMFRIGSFEEKLRLKEGHYEIAGIKVNKQFLSYALWSRLGFLFVVPDILKFGPTVHITDNIEVAWLAKIGAILAIPTLSYFSKKIVERKAQHVILEKQVDSQNRLNEIHAEYESEFVPKLARKGKSLLGSCLNAFR